MKLIPLKFGLAAGALFCSLLLTVPLLLAQGGAGSIEGFVRDAQKRPVAGAKVWLDDQVEGKTQSAITDSAGHFRFEGVTASTYVVRAQKSGYRDATQGPMALKRDEAALVSLQMTEVSLNEVGKTEAQAMEYSDEPNFTVAGVSDPSDVGGHGSNVTLPTKEALAKDTASLAKDAPDIRKPARVQTGGGVQHAEPIDGNLEMGKALLQGGQTSDAIALLERARKSNPKELDPVRWLALAYLKNGDLKRADALAEGAALQGDTGDVHALIAEIKEGEGLYLEAAREYQRAAELEPSEAHLFSWGAELLLHHAYEPASEVFSKGHRLYPKSIRILVGLGASAYAQDLHDQAAHWLLAASDIDPSDPRPYVFLGKVQEVAKSEPQEWVEAFQRFAKLQPDNARAHYLYAVALEKQRRGETDFAAREVELNRAIALDPKFGDSYLALGLLQAERHEYAKSVASLQKAVQYTPLPDEAHLRLAQVYRAIGETEKARAETQLYNQVSEKKKEQLERERRELGQFVYTLQGEAAPADKPAPKP